MTILRVINILIFQVQCSLTEEGEDDDELLDWPVFQFLFCVLYIKDMYFQSITILISCITLFSVPVSAQIEEIIVTAQKA